jgi:Tol biopolymer transport system component
MSRRNRAVMVYVRGQFDSNIWRTPGPLATGAATPPARFVESTQLDFVPQFSPDRGTIAFISRRSGTTELWTSSSDGANLTRLTFLEQDDLEMNFAWSPDGREIVLTAWAGGNRDIHVIPAHGGNPERITTTPAHERFPSFSRDGRSIYFTSRQSGADEIWKVSRSGGSPMQVTRHGGVEAHEAADGRALYFTKAVNYTLPQGIWRTSPVGGEEEMILDRGFSQQWGVFGDGICYVNVDLKPGSGVFIDCHDFATRSVRRVATLDRMPQVPGFSISSDGQWILFTGTDTNDSDVMMVENFR